MSGSIGDGVAAATLKQASHAPAWQEDDWEPPEPSGHLMPLEELRNKIHSTTEDHQKKGHITVSGRTIFVCHTLPYTCSYARALTPDLRSQSDGTHAIDVKPEPMLDSLHAPTTRRQDAAMPSMDLINPPKRKDTPSQIYDEPGQTENVMSPATKSHFRWVLSPRRVHAALNSGVKSLAENSKIIMIAWPGDVRDTNGQKIGLDLVTEQQKDELEDGFKHLAGDDSNMGVQCLPVWLRDGIANAFYNDYCKAFLWPTFHYLGLSDHQSSEKEAKAWAAYVAANQAYADRVVEQYQEGDLIWIQDYHLMLVPRMLRQKIPQAAIGLFLHSPFPSSEFFRCLPRREVILNGMLGANLCCFQTYSYGRHFISSCVRVCGYEALEGGIGVDARGNITNIAYSPIGIDSDRIEQEIAGPSIKPKIDAFRQLYKGKKIIVGRDKLDSTKGVLPKLEAYEAFLSLFPEWNGKVVLIQVTTPTANDSPQVARKISRLVDHINGTYGNLSFAPLHHYHQVIDRDEYFALLTVADLALITSIRDGMNTTSMEYVLCQKDTHNPLILSEFTGVTGSMKSAIKVNPWDANGYARAIDTCLNMPSQEKADRHAQLYKRVTTQSAAVWAHTLVYRLLQSLKRDPATLKTPRLDVQIMLDRYKKSKKRLMMFDYDGTLTPIVKVPSAALPSQSLLKSLEILAGDPKNVLYIISGRDGDFLTEHLGHIKGLGFSAEHGSFLREPGETEWKNLTEHIDMSWQQDVIDIFRYYEARTTGSFVEIKRVAVTFHYRNADPEYGEFQAKECQALLDNMVGKLPIDVIVGKKNLEVRPAHTHKGEIVRRLTYQHADSDFLMCAGDDKTDEDMFRAIFGIESSETNDNDRRLWVTPPPSLTLFPSLASTITIPDNPVIRQHRRSSTPLGDNVPGQLGVSVLPPLKSNFRPDALFSIAVIAPGARKTIAKWHLEEPSDLLQVLEQCSSISQQT